MWGGEGSSGEKWGGEGSSGEKWGGEGSSGDKWGGEGSSSSSSWGVPREKHERVPREKSGGERVHLRKKEGGGGSAD